MHVELSTTGTILLATDGNEYARQAAEQAIDLAEAQGATLHVIYVVDRRRFDDPARSSAELVTIYAEYHGGLCVNEVVDIAEERDVRVEGDTRHGIPHEVILDYADEINADVIVVGKHGSHEEHFSGVGQNVLEGKNGKFGSSKSRDDDARGREQKHDERNAQNTRLDGSRGQQRYEVRASL